jgi:hypothetical protein
LSRDDKVNLLERGALKKYRATPASIRSARIYGGGEPMNKLIEENLQAVLKREGLAAKPGDLDQFAEIIELYMENLQQLHSVNLGAEELAPVFRPEWSGKSK